MKTLKMNRRRVQQTNGSIGIEKWSDNATPRIGAIAESE